VCLAAKILPLSGCFAGIYRERLWPRVCCRKSAFWIEMGKLVPGFMLQMRLCTVLEWIWTLSDNKIVDNEEREN